MAMPKTETVSVYKPNKAQQTNLNSVDGPVTLVQSGVKCNIHRGAPLDPQDAAYVLGVDNSLGAYAYFNIDAASYLVNRYVIVDEDNQAWLIHNVPAVRKRFVATAHVRCLLLQLQLRPNGLP